MSTAVNRETIKRKRGEEGVGWWWGEGGCLGGHIIEVGKLRTHSDLDDVN